MSLDQRSLLNSDFYEFYRDRRTPFGEMLEERKNKHLDVSAVLKIDRKKACEVDSLMTLH
jgi:hypothetical protein